MTTVDDGTRPSTGLRRDVGRIGLLFASIGSIIGSGWLFGVLKASKTAGPAAVLSWAIGGVMILLIALVYAELGTMFPLSGGVVRFPHLSFGGFASYTAGWITWVAAATVAPIEVEGALQYATKYAPFTTTHTVSGQTVHTLTGLGYGVAVVLMAVFVVVNYVGIAYFARINNALVWWKLFIILLVIAAFLLSTRHGSNFTSQGFRPQGWSGVFSAIATSGIVFSYLGFRQGIELAGETDNPRRNVPIAVIGSVLITTLIYVGLQVAFILAVPSADIAKGWANLDFANSFGPLAAIATIIGLGWLAVLLYIDAVVSPADTGLIYTTVTGRISYAMARNGNAPRALASVTRRGVPLVSLIVAFAVGLIIFLPFPSWQQLVGFITSATVLSFGSGPLVLAAMRRQLPDRERTFRLPFGDVIPYLAFLSSNLIVYWTGWTTDWKLFVSILLGFVLLGIFRLLGITQQMDWAAGLTWVAPWLAGLTVLSFVGAYDGGRGWLTGIVSLPVIAAFSLGIYWLAVRYRLPSEIVEQHIADAEAEAEVEEAELGPNA